jgi:hypothetical protein
MKRKILAAGLLAMLLLAACSKLTAKNYEQLKMGMSYDEVKALLGTPDECSDVLGVKQCRWGDEKRYISVSFAGDKVMIFTAENIR